MTIHSSMANRLPERQKYFIMTELFLEPIQSFYLKILIRKESNVKETLAQESKLPLVQAQVLEMIQELKQVQARLGSVSQLRVHQVKRDKKKKEVGYQ